jgi:AcrR family transcriptional regulator
MSTYETSRLVHQPHQQRSREALAKIITAAELLLRANGFEGFSMAALAEVAGIPAGNIYRRFRGKAELLLALKEGVTRRLEQTVETHLAGKAFSNIDEVVHATVDAMVLGFTKDEKLHRALFSGKISDPSVHQVGWSGRSRVFSLYREALLPLLKALPPDNAELLTRVSFEIMVSPIVGKARSDNDILNSLSWTVLSTEIIAATTAYLKFRLAS